MFHTIWCHAQHINYGENRLGTTTQKLAGHWLAGSKQVHHLFLYSNYYFNYSYYYYSFLISLLPSFLSCPITVFISTHDFYSKFPPHPAVGLGEQLCGV